MKVLHLSKLSPPFWGGIETVAYDICYGLNKNNIQTDIISVSEDFSSSVENIDGIKITRCASFAHIASTYLSFSYLYNWLKVRNKYDIVHIHCPNPLANLAVFLFRTDSKIILHWHSDIVKQRFLKLLLSPMENWLLRRADVIITTSEPYTVASVDLEKHQNKIEVVPIGIDENKFSSMGTDPIKTKYDGKKIVFSLGRHVYYKGFKYLIDAAQYLPNNYIILIGGQGPLSEEFRKEIESNSLSSKVILLGKIPQSELSYYFKACDVFCLPSVERSEAYGVVQLEAMSQGKPIVSTSIPGSGVSWVNVDGVTGIVVEPKNSEALSKAIIDVCENEKFNKNTILNVFNEKFTRDMMVAKIMKIYNHLLKE